MQSAENLWTEFIAFCGAQAPDDWLAVDFVLRRDGPERAAGAWHSQRDLHVLQRLLTWRARNSLGG